jgi:asparagine synthetase B (glutamine-hydrolysing)
MCGIIAAFGVQGCSRDELRRLGLKLSKILRHRGPDANAIYVTDDATGFLAHERLNIVDATDRGRCGGRQTISRVTDKFEGSHVPCDIQATILHSRQWGKNYMDDVRLFGDC